MSDFTMPSLGADMEAGTLVEWKVAPGAHVKRGDVIALVETEKGIIEVEVWEPGIIDALVVEPGTKVPVGTVLARLRAADGAPSPRLAASPPPPPSVAPAPPVTASATVALASPPTRAVAAAPAPHVMASPAARQLARERGVDLAGVHGTGPHGAITRGDVERAAAPARIETPSPPPAAAPASAAPRADAMRHAIGAAMARSKREIPHYYLSADIDVARARAWLEAENASRSVTERVLFAAVLLKATARAIADVPEVNGTFVDGAYRPSAAVHVGVAISLRGGGLVAPAMHDVERRSVRDVQAALTDLVARARAGRLRSSEMSDATITVTNLGEQGVASVFGVIYPPQVALVGFGKVSERPWAASGMLGVRPIVTATLSADHRVSDGHRGALFLAALDRVLQLPEEL